MKRIFTLMSLMLLFSVTLMAGQPKIQKIYIASLNDQHANIDNYPQFAALIDSLRSVHPDLLLVAAGDNRSGNPINDRYAEPSKPMYDLMNEVGFDLSCFGNHEWDGGMSGLHKVLDWANFPFICANVTFEDSLDLHSQPYVVIERDGLKLAFVGAIQLGPNGLPDSHPKNLGGAHFSPITEVLPQYLKLRDENNALILVSHCGYEEDRETAELFPQLDVIIGGHTHTRVAETQIVNGVMITQAESKVKYVTLSTLTFEDGQLIDKQEELLSVRDFPKRNKKVKAMLDDFNSNEFFCTVICNNLTAINTYEQLGCIMTDAIRYTAGADMGFQNPGGVRFDTLSVRPVTMKDVFTLDPFDNEIIQYTLSGEEIIRLMKVCYTTDGGPIYCSGCSYTYKEDENGEMTDISVILENGKPLDMSAKYKVVMNSYMASVFDYEHEDPGTSTFRTSNDMMIDYLGKHPDIDYGSISRVTEK